MWKAVLAGSMLLGVGALFYMANAGSGIAPLDPPKGFGEFTPGRGQFEEVAEPGQGEGGFAANRIAPLEIDGNRFMEYLKAVAAIGPRMSTTAGMRKQQELIIAHFEKLKLKVAKQTFQAKQVTRAEPVEMTNLIISFAPDKKKRAIICSHYDTRPIADQEPDPRKWREPFVSANDGGSGVAFLMEFAHHFDKLKLEVGVDLVLFDGEEFIFDSKQDKYFLGSEHFAKSWRIDRNRPDYLGAVLLDMIAGKAPKFPAEGNSYAQCFDLCVDIWRIGAEHKIKSIVNRIGAHVQDDHLALQNVGIPAIDIIDFDYPHWHRLSDTPENCSPEGPIDIAKILSIWLQRQK